MATDAPSRGVRSRAGTVFWYVVLTALSVVVLSPIYMTIVRALSNPSQVIFRARAPLWVVDPQWDAFKVAFTQGHLGRPLVISLVMTLIIVAGQTITSVLAAYAFAFLEFPFKRLLFAVTVATLLL